MDFIENIEPIHEMPFDELNHALNTTRDQLEILWEHPKTDPRETRKAIEYQVDFNLNTLIHSLKKSLLYFYPEREKELLEVVNAKTAMWVKRLILETRVLPSPLYEGISALTKLYLSLGPHYSCRPEDLHLALSDFSEMEVAIKNYVAIAVEPSVRRDSARQGGSCRGGRAKKKKRGILEAIDTLMETHGDMSAAAAWKHFRKTTSEEKPIRTTSAQVFFSRDPHDLNGKDNRLVQVDGEREQSIGFSAFKKYFSSVKKNRIRK